MIPTIKGDKNLINGAFFQIATLLLNIHKSYAHWLVDSAFSKLIILLLKQSRVGEKTVTPRIFNF